MSNKQKLKSPTLVTSLKKEKLRRRLLNERGVQRAAHIRRIQELAAKSVVPASVPDEPLEWTDDEVREVLEDIAKTRERLLRLEDIAPMEEGDSYVEKQQEIMSALLPDKQEK